MKKKRIVWIDDDLGSPILRPYIDEFIENNFEVIKVREIDNLLPILKNEAKKDLHAILVDLVMSPRHLDFNKTRGGLRTGLVVVEDILKEDSLNKIPIIIVTNANDIVVSNFCKDKSIAYIEKKDYFSDEFVVIINKIISNSIIAKNKSNE